MKLDVAGLLQSVGVNVTALEAQATNYLLQQAAVWARVPTRLRRDRAALAIVQGAAAQRNRADVVAQGSVIASALTKFEALYDGASGDVADVMDVVRGLAPGQLPPVSIAPKAAKAVAAMRAVLSGLTSVEGSLTGMASKVLTPEQQKQLLSGMAFPSFMAGAGKQLLLYLLVGIPIYFVVTKKSHGTRHW